MLQTFTIKIEESTLKLINDSRSKVRSFGERSKFFINLVLFLSKLFYRAPRSDYFRHYIVFLFPYFADQRGFQLKRNLFGGAMVN